MTPDQLRTRARVESVIGLIAPALNVVLAAGDRFSRIIDREDQEYYPPATRISKDSSPSVTRGGAQAPPP